MNDVGIRNGVFVIAPNGTTAIGGSTWELQARQHEWRGLPGLIFLAKSIVTEIPNTNRTSLRDFAWRFALLPACFEVARLISEAFRTSPPPTENLDWAFTFRRGVETICMGPADVFKLPSILYAETDDPILDYERELAARTSLLALASEANDQVAETFARRDLDWWLKSRRKPPGLRGSISPPS
jgi:hypothetical protein